MKVSVSIQEQNTPGTHNAVLGQFCYLCLHCEGHVKLHASFSVSFQKMKSTNMQVQLEMKKVVFLQKPIAIQLA